MKFLASLFGAMFLGIVFCLLLGFALQCEHENMIKVFSFQSENSTAMSDIKTLCDECGNTFSLVGFRGTPSDTSYVDVINEHCKDKKFVSGEYDTIKATVVFPDCDALKTKIQCVVQQGDVEVYFTAMFKGEYEDAVSLIQKGDEITFRGKSSAKGLSWSDCELIVD